MRTYIKLHLYLERRRHHLERKNNNSVYYFHSRDIPDVETSEVAEW